jgi:hypothetical protein
MPYKNPMGQTYDTGAVRKGDGPGLALADWNGFDARAAQSKAQWQAARPGHRHLPGMDRRQRV